MTDTPPRDSAALAALAGKFADTLVDGRDPYRGTIEQRGHAAAAYASMAVAAAIREQTAEIAAFRHDLLKASDMWQAWANR